MQFEEAKLRTALKSAWSRDTAVQWTPENPANGQCNVTAAVVHALFGGDILRTWLSGVWHYYNRIDGKRYDLTECQFTAPGARFPAPQTYDDQAATMAQAMAGIPQREYDTLKNRLLEALEA